MRHDIDFSQIPLSLDALAYVAQHLAAYVAYYPQQVTAGCLLYLAGTKFLSSLRRSRK